jgi:hypothetical protein
MADYTFQYRANAAIQPRSDGTGYCDLDLEAVSRLSTAQANDPYTAVPGKHKTVSLPAARLQTALATPGNNAVKVAALKAVMREFLFSGAPVSVPDDWEAAGLEVFMDKNDEAVTVAAAFNAFILVVKPTGFPVTFPL